MDKNRMIEIKFTGERIFPEKVKAYDLAEVIKSVEDMLLNVVVDDNPAFKKDDIVISLVGIQHGSVGLQFVPQCSEQVFAASERIAEVTNQGDFSELPYHAIKSLQKISSFTQKYHCDMELLVQNGEWRHLATLTSDTEISIPKPLIGETVIYGQVLRVGGKEPRLMFEPINSLHVIYCDIDRALARQLAPKLYMWVGLCGTAQWNIKTLEIEEFTVKSIIEYEHTPIADAMQGLSKLIGSYFDDVDDVENYVDTLRDEQMEL